MSLRIVTIVLTVLVVVYDLARVYSEGLGSELGRCYLLLAVNQGAWLLFALTLKQMGE